MRNCLLIVAAAAALSQSLQPAMAGPECLKFGSPSYTAQRIELIGKRRLTSRVFVRGADERVEYESGGERHLIIVKGNKTFLINLSRGKGVVTSRPRDLETKGGVQMNVSRKGDNFLVRIDRERPLRGIRNEALCRSDGVTLSKFFPVFVQGKVLQGAFMHKGVRVAPIDNKYFDVPGGIDVVSR